MVKSTNRVVVTSKSYKRCPKGCSLVNEPLDGLCFSAALLDTGNAALLFSAGAKRKTRLCKRCIKALKVLGLLDARRGLRQ